MAKRKRRRIKQRTVRAPNQGVSSVADITKDKDYEPALTALLRQGSVPNVVSINAAKDRHRVTAMEDIKGEVPQLYLAVHVLGPTYEVSQFAQMFVRTGSYRAESLEKADLVIFTGGADVDPRLYGETAHSTTRFSEHRDSEDIAAYMKCLDLGIPMFGVCRGAQFLHVMNGGKLFQDVDNHQTAHGMWDQVRNVFIRDVSSVHHQMCIENKDMQVIAYMRGHSKKRWRNDKISEEFGIADVEAFYYRDTACFGVQGHPEYRNYTQYTKWCLQAIEDYIISNPDIEWRDKSLRLKQDILDKRKPVIITEDVKEESVEATRTTRRKKAS